MKMTMLVKHTSDKRKAKRKGRSECDKRMRGGERSRVGMEHQRQQRGWEWVNKNGEVNTAYREAGRTFRKKTNGK